MPYYYSISRPSTQNLMNSIAMDLIYPSDAFPNRHSSSSPPSYNSIFDDNYISGQNSTSVAAHAVQKRQLHRFLIEITAFFFDIDIPQLNPTLDGGVSQCVKARQRQYPERERRFSLATNANRSCTYPIKFDMSTSKRRVTSTTPPYTKALRSLHAACRRHWCKDFHSRSI